MKKHDLSAGVVKLNYQTLLETAQIAKAYSRHGIERALSEIQQNGGRKQTSSVLSESLVCYAKSFEIANETVNALEGMKERADVEWIEKPVIL